MKKVLMLATTAAMIEQFNKNNILILNSLGYTVDVAGNFKEGNPISEERIEAFKIWIQEQGGNYYHLPTDRSPIRLDHNLSAYKQVVQLILKNQYAFIHVHTPIGSVIGRYAAKKTKTPIIYTAHGFHFYKHAPLKNWMMYYPIEKHCSRFTDCLVTITKEDYAFAGKKMHARSLKYVPGVGVDLTQFDAGNISLDRRIELKKSIGLKEEDILLLSVGELNENKNHQVIISTLQELVKKDNRIHYVIIGKGALKEELEQLSKNHQVEEHVHLLGFCSNVREWCATADVFVFPSYREGLSVSLMEAMASGLPCAVSEIRGNVDLIDNKLGGFYFDPHRNESVKAALIKLLSSDLDKLSSYNLEKIKSFRKEKIAEEMKKIYIAMGMDVSNK